MGEPAFELKRASDDLEVDIVLRLNSNGGAVSVEDRFGKRLKEVDITKEPIQGTVQALEPVILITTKINPTCTWVRIGNTYYYICK